MSRVCVTGLGYIGLPTAAMLASRGHEVIGCDTDPAVVEAIRSGRAHFREPDLDMLLSAAIGTGRLTAGSAPIAAEFHVIAVPTPCRAMPGPAPPRPDVSHVEAAVDAVAPLLRVGDTLILESTLPVGTTEAVTARIARARPDLRLPTLGGDTPGDIAVAHCPERVLPGRMLRELVSNDRIVGGMTASCARRARALYEGFVTGGIVLADCRTAEFAKLAENAYRDVNVAYANELSLIAAAAGVDVWQAIALANRHPRVGILSPGAGVGGHCIAVDPWFLVDAAAGQAPLIRTARAVNDAKPAWVADRILAMAAPLPSPVIALLGATYKPDVDDLRGSPALAIIEAVASAREDATVLVVEPAFRSLPPALARHRNVTLAAPGDALLRSDVVGLLVAHHAFRCLDPSSFRAHLVVDATGLLSTPRRWPDPPSATS